MHIYKNIYFKKKYIRYVCVLNTGYPVHALYLFYRMPRSAEGTRRPPPGQEKTEETRLAGTRGRHRAPASAALRLSAKRRCP